MEPQATPQDIVEAAPVMQGGDVTEHTVAPSQEAVDEAKKVILEAEKGRQGECYKEINAVLEKYKAELSLQYVYTIKFK